jgi:hypothetical protein
MLIKSYSAMRRDPLAISAGNQNESVPGLRTYMAAYASVTKISIPVALRPRGGNRTSHPKVTPPSDADIGERSLNSRNGVSRKTSTVRRLSLWNEPSHASEIPQSLDVSLEEQALT